MQVDTPTGTQHTGIYRGQSTGPSPMEVKHYGGKASHIIEIDNFTETRLHFNFKNNLNCI